VTSIDDLEPFAGAHVEAGEREVAAGVRTLTVSGLPMLVVDLPRVTAVERVRRALRDAGLVALSQVLGIEFPKGARVGVLLDGDEVRLVDEQETALLRLVRGGLAPDWTAAAVRLRGTMICVTAGLDVASLDESEDLLAALDASARAGSVDGAIIGVHDRRPRLPLVF
jgi:hypothetical protein